MKQAQSNPVGWVITLKMNNTIRELKLSSTNEPYAHMQTAINAVKKLREGYQGEGEWVAMTTIRLADIHRMEWDKARV
jgi:hypothetical protein